MDAHNVAIVIAPNIVYCDTMESSPETILREMDWTNQIVEKLILHVHKIFTPDFQRDSDFSKIFSCDSCES